MKQGKTIFAANQKIKIILKKVFLNHQNTHVIIKDKIWITDKIWINLGYKLALYSKNIVPDTSEFLLGFHPHSVRLHSTVSIASERVHKKGHLTILNPQWMEY